MNLFCFKRQSIVCFNNFLFNHLSVSRSQTLCLYSINQMFVKNLNTFKFNNKYNNNKRFDDLKQNKQTFDQKVYKNKKIIINKSRTEEWIDFDSRFSDTFGNLSGYDTRFKRLSAEDMSDDDDNYDVLEIKRGPKMAEIGYRKLLNECINKKPIQMTKALELFDKMVSEDRIPPHRCTYTLLISGCAKVGYTEKAFQLFDQLLKYELKPTKPTITALFNACAECPFPEYGLQKARYLREWMSLQGFVANTLHYNSMIKAFGKLGDIGTAFQLVDEMVANGQTTTSETFAMLLMGCISNKDSGLYEAIKIYHRMKSHNMSIDIYIFNLLLRAIRDCSIGSEDNLNLLIQNSSRPTKPMYSNNDSNHKNNCRKNDSNIRENKTLNIDCNSKSLITRTPNLLIENSFNETNIIKIDYKSLSSPSNRFMLFGGIKGFIQMMNDYNVRPNINTLTLMTEVSDLNEESEKQILDLLEEFKIRADTDFFNILIKKVCFNRGITSATNILSIMNQKGLQPNIVTFGVLSLGCNSFALGKQMLTDMECLNIKPNFQIMGTLITQACYVKNFWYINHLIDYMKNNDIKPDQTIVEKLELIKIEFQKMLSNYDWNKCDIPQRFKDERFRNSFTTFKTNYEQWIQNVTIEETDHPWFQFQFDELPKKKGMHSFVKYMKQKIKTRRGISEETHIDEYEEDELYDD